ncbi:MAG: MBOAT family protein [Kofleriaceae bacterium]
MIFSSATFLIFLVFVLSIVAIARSETQRRIAIFVASLFFYGWWDWRFCFFLVAASTIDYKLALLIQQSSTQTTKKRWLALSLCSNLGLLAVFKYLGWFVASVNEAFGSNIPVPDIPLPLGISFFTFQAMSYTIDVYRGHFDPSRRWFDFSFSMSFFPHLISGPIVRAAHFMPQLREPHPLRMEDLHDGVARFSRGFLKKTLLADQFAVCADQIFADPAFFSSPSVWVGVFAYSAQIYYDFSGYTDMAIGLARMFGFHFPENFDHPYLSGNITEFWRRWHISLSTWLRDYLYISLGGNRKGRARTYLNLMLTMLLGGLWHGANWTFVAWGALHGIALAVHKLVSERWPEPGPLRRAFGMPITFVFVTLCWVFFRSPTFAEASVVFQKLAFVDSSGAEWMYSFALSGFALAVCSHLYRTLTKQSLSFNFRRPIHVALLAFLLTNTLLFSRTGTNPFIYFQF